MRISVNRCRKWRIALCLAAGLSISIATFAAKAQNPPERHSTEFDRLEGRVETMKEASAEYKALTEGRLARIEAEAIRTREILSRFETMIYGIVTALGLLVFEAVLGLLGVRPIRSKPKEST